jgi:hypothetical protein
MQQPVSPDVGTGLESQTHALAFKAIATECKAILRPLPQRSLRCRIMILSSKAKYTSPYDGTSSVSPCRMPYWPRIICEALIVGSHRRRILRQRQCFRQLLPSSVANVGRNRRHYVLYGRHMMIADMHRLIYEGPSMGVLGRSSKVIYGRVVSVCRGADRRSGGPVSSKRRQCHATRRVTANRV